MNDSLGKKFVDSELKRATHKQGAVTVLYYADGRMVVEISTDDNKTIIFKINKENKDSLAAIATFAGWPQRVLEAEPAATA